MTTNNHPITPPPELVEQWRDEALNSFPDDENPCPCDIDDARDEHIATQAARWGADQELEACVEHLKRIWSPSDTIDSLYTARRPKPPSLAEPALALLDKAEDPSWDINDFSVIRCALEHLQELEKGNE